jgi:hypothetical protein
MISTLNEMVYRLVKILLKLLNYDINRLPYSNNNYTVFKITRDTRNNPIIAGGGVFFVK